MLRNISCSDQFWHLSKNPEFFFIMVYGIVFNIINNNNNAAWAPIQQIWLITTGSCDTEDWNNGWWKFCFSITGINYITKNVYICLH